MKRLVIVTRCLLSGGAERVVSELANYAIKVGIECSVIMLDEYEVFYKVDDSIKLYTIGKQSSNPLFDKFKRYKKVRSIVKSLEPDLVLTLPEDIGIYVIPAMIGSGIPVVVSERNNPWVMPYNKLSRIMRKIFYPCAAGYVFQTQMAASFFSEKIQSRGRVIPNPLDISKIPSPFVGQRKKTVVAAGRLDNQKNFKLLIDTFAAFYKTHPDYSLRIFGEGGLRTELENYAQTVLPDGVWSMPGRDINWLEKSVGCSMFVLSSDYEGMPNALIEAMAAGIPSISTDCPSGGSAELIENNENGILIPVKDKEAMVQAMNKIADDKEFADGLSAKGMLLRKKLETDKISSKWFEYLKECIR